MGDITQRIARAQGGDRAALDDLFTQLYPELRRIARGRLSQNRRDALMETTGLVHECYMKFVAAQRLAVQDRAHFLAYAATVMRSVIVDAVRAARAARRGGDAAHVTLDSRHADSVPVGEAEIIDVAAALQDLAQLNPRLVQVVEMRYFAGMTDAEIGESLGITERTVRRDWEKARLLLAHALRG